MQTRAPVSVGRGYVLLVLVLVLLGVAIPSETEEEEDALGRMVGQVVKQHLSGCHLVLLSTSPYSPVLATILRVVNDGAVFLAVEESLGVALLPQVLWWGDSKTTCRALILLFDSHNHTNTAMAFRLLEQAGLYKLAETRVVVLGTKADREAILLHPSLRNVVHGIYLAVPPGTVTESHAKISFKGRSESPAPKDSAERQRIFVYRRCMYCNGGMAGIEYLARWDSASLLSGNLSISPELLHSKAHLSNFQGYQLKFTTARYFPYMDYIPHSKGPLTNVTPRNYVNFSPLLAIITRFKAHLSNFQGRQLKFTTARYFPYMDYIPHSKEPLTTVTPRDCVDYRLMEALARTLNFTYIIREEPNRVWGVEKNGTFSGMVGRLEREEADLSTVTSPAPDRNRAAQFNAGYPSDLMTVISLKPKLLPQHLALIRPFAGEVWVGVLAAVVVWGVTLWILQGLWVFLVGGPGVQLNTALLYSWGALLEKPPSDPSTNVSGQMLVGWWLVFCLVILTGFKSALIAHLTVQGKSTPMETMEDLVTAGGWQWALEPWILTGLPYMYFSKHTDPVVQQIFQGMEVLSADKAMEKVRRGGYSLIDFNNYITILVNSYYTDARGWTPFYISKKTFSIMATFGWGFRKGAPFFLRFELMIQRLTDAGLVAYWSEEVINQRIKENRAAAKLDETSASAYGEESREVILGLSHLQGAFYLLFLGCVLAFLTLLGEMIAHARGYTY